MTGQRVRYALRTARILWQASGPLMIAWVATLVLQGIVPVATVWLTKPLVDGLQAAIGGGTSAEALQPLLGIATLYAVLLVSTELLGTARLWIGLAQSERVQDHLADLVHAKSATVDFAFFENADSLDKLDRVRSDAVGRPLQLLDGFGSLVQNTITVTGIGALLVAYGPWVAVALLAGTLPAFFVVMKANREQHAWFLSSTTDRRRTAYVSELLTDAAPAAEVRLFGWGDFLRAKYRQLRKRLVGERMRMIRRHSLKRLGAEAVAILSSGGVLGWMVWRALNGLATLGDIALFAQAFQRAQGLVRALFGNVNQLHSNALFLENLFEFLDLRPTVVGPPSPAAVPAPLRQGIRFREVTFRYPGTDRVALDRFSCEIPAGRTVAIVGANGAGKSTLIKLLARFYDPQEGSVEIDGVNLREMDPGALHGIMTVMVQHPVPFQGSARENITMSDLRSAPTPARIDEVVQDAGATALVSRLPQGLDSLLGKQFPGGTELSGGEWQRITMARAYYRRSPLVVLDEPTSQMDSWAEHEWFARFQHLTQGATAVIVTHRLAIARRADLIHVMDAGRVVETGTHDELIARGGRYSESWAAQQQAIDTAESA